MAIDPACCARVCSNRRFAGASLRLPSSSAQWCVFSWLASPEGRSASPFCPRKLGLGEFWKCHVQIVLRPPRGQGLGDQWFPAIFPARKMCIRSLACRVPEMAGSLRPPRIFTAETILHAASSANRHQWAPSGAAESDRGPPRRWPSLVARPPYVRDRETPATADPTLRRRHR